jgi:hypothetical protein
MIRCITPLASAEPNPSKGKAKKTTLKEESTVKAQELPVASPVKAT